MPYKIAADVGLVGLTAVFPMFLGLLLTLDLTLAMSMVGLDKGTLRGAEAIGSWDCADEACEGPPSRAKRFLRNYQQKK